MHIYLLPFNICFFPTTCARTGVYMLSVRVGNEFERYTLVRVFKGQHHPVVFPVCYIHHGAERTTCNEGFAVVLYRLSEEGKGRGRPESTK